MADRRRAPGMYRVAQLRARKKAGALERDAAKRVIQSLRNWADDLVAGVSKLPGGAAGVAATAKLTREVAKDLEESLQQAILENRTLSFAEVEKIWQEAGESVGRAKGLSNAALGRIRNPPLSMLGVYEGIGGSSTWRTLTARTVAKASAEVDSIIRNGLLQGVSPDVLARRLRPYVQGSEPFHKAFGGLKGVNLQSLRDPALKEAAQTMKYNSMRIAVSEVHNARAEAELQHFANDPYIRAVAWRLAPDRGEVEAPDVCDSLAESDFFGLGPGIYPVNQVPIPPHPFDRCERVPITGDTPGEKLVGNFNPKGFSVGDYAIGKDKTLYIKDRAMNVMALTDQSLAKVNASHLMAAPQVPLLPGYGAPSPPFTSVHSHALSMDLMESWDYLLKSGFDIESGALSLDGAAAASKGPAIQQTAQAIKELEAAGVDTTMLPGSSNSGKINLGLVEGSGPEGAIAEYLPHDDMLVLFNADALDLATLEAHSKKMYEMGFQSTNHPRHYIHHELGHSIMGESVGSTVKWAEMGSTSPSEWAIEFAHKNLTTWDELIRIEVSNYAAVNAHEFAAEVFAGLVNGKKYSSEIMWMYERVGGYVPEGGFKFYLPGGKGATSLEKLIAPAPPADWMAGIHKYAPDSAYIRKGLLAGATPEEIMVQVKSLHADSKISAKAIRKVKRDLVKAGQLTKEGVPVTAVPKPVSTPVTPMVPPPPPPPPVPEIVKTFVPQPVVEGVVQTLDEKVVLAKKVGEQAGSNPGGLYEGSDGVKRYVKFYATQEQAWNEALANRIYTDLGSRVPQSAVFEHGGKWAFASEYIPNAATVQQVSLTTERALKILEHSINDVFLANWDAVGLSLDNAVLAEGKLFRIDQGGSLLFRAKGAAKTTEAVMNLTELESFITKNPAYASVFKKAGYTGFFDPAFAPSVIKQLDEVVSYYERIKLKYGSFNKYIERVLPQADNAFRLRVSEMLNVRAVKIKELRQGYEAAVKAAEQKALAAKKAAEEAAAKAKIEAAAKAQKQAELQAKLNQPLADPPPTYVKPATASLEGATESLEEALTPASSVASTVGAEQAKKVRKILRDGFKRGYSNETIQQMVQNKVQVNISVNDIAWWRKQRTGGAELTQALKQAGQLPHLEGEAATQHLKTAGRRFDLDKQQLEALRRYQGAYSGEINFALRGVRQMTAEARGWIEEIDIAFTKGLILERDLIVNRGTGASFFNVKNTADIERAVGTIFESPSYVSTSSGSGFGGEVKMKIRIPAGQRVLWMNAEGLGVHSGEKEVLLPRKARFKIISAKRQGGHTLYVEVEMLPHGI